MRRGGLVLVSLILIVPLLVGMGSADASFESQPCPGFTIVEGQGPSCPADGGWRVLLDNGNRLFTHGPDPVPTEAHLAEPELEPLAAQDREPTCASIGSARMVLVYTVPRDKPNRYATMAEPVREMARTANMVLSREAAEFGHEIDYRIECGLTGELTVYEVLLVTPADSDSFATITSELQARGFDDPLAKYWVWHDDRVPGIGGQANLPRGDAPTMLNGAASGPHYALTYGYHSWRIMMHENGHNMGAVQDGAPHTSGAGHCNDGRDVMCYRDGGAYSGGFSNSVCTDRTHFDCNHDDYFHPAPPAGNYLHDHWNLASHLNPFVEIPDRCTPINGVVVDQASAAGPTEHWAEDLSASCGGRYFSFVSPRAFPVLTRDLDVCWYQGSTVLACHDTPGNAASGTIPPGADRARITYTGGGVAAFSLNVN